VISPLIFTLDSMDVYFELYMVENLDTSPENLEEIRSIMMWQKVSCTLRNRMKNIDTHKVWCNLEDGALLSQVLINNNLVSEDCSESWNQFWTCLWE